MKLLKKLMVPVLVLTIIAGLFPARSAQAATKPAKAKVTAKANDDGTSVTLTIAKTKNAQGYKIMVKKPGAKKFTKLATISEDGTAKRTYTAKDLKEGEYQFKVRAYLKNGKKTVWGKYSKVTKVKIEKTAETPTPKQLGDGEFWWQGKVFVDNGSEGTKGEVEFLTPDENGNPTKVRINAINPVGTKVNGTYSITAVIFNDKEQGLEVSVKNNDFTMVKFFTDEGLFAMIY